MDAPEIPFMIYAESTPNPESMKFVANKMLLPNGATAQYDSKMCASLFICALYHY